MKPLCISLLIPAALFAGATVYNPPHGVEQDKVFQVKVAGQSSFVYSLPVGGMTYFSYSSFARRADIEITVARPVETVAIRPKSLNIRPVVTGNVITFRLDRTAQLSIEINGDTKHPLLLFANPPESAPPKPGPTGVHYFAAGTVHNVGRITVTSGQLVYIAGGAIVRGSIFMDQARDVHIFGRGILDGSLYKRGESRMIEINRSSDVDIEGIIVTNSKHWTIPITASDKVTLRNVKLVSDNDWDDGVDVVGSTNVTVDQCFIRTKDDCIAIKAGVDYFTKFNNQRDVSNVIVKRSVLWNGAWGNGLEIGFETRAASISGIRFLDNDLIHVEGPEGTFTIHNGDRAVVSDVIYDNCRVEDAQGLLVDFKILKSRYSKDEERGQIRNIQFRHIRVDHKEIPSLLQGFDAKHQIGGVVFEDVIVDGRKWTSLVDAGIKATHAEQITFK
ncbi:glycosyl hydrolase family 28 protein [Paludibaculum fermentans]|uniref:Right-handed parallel beta-helix repeat-containing protein n=1 Tax=Paludibaculum fermentans TaxID=1473598 RepID=A0A7S7NT25_PALFE|nr:glycosyl hydrolase family 28 protein [Paludibaculum fermentans]QOY89194.1 right-handed parallel beta-helix repeat-containing protein [Paludibaculum fermentans]